MMIPLIFLTVFSAYLLISTVSIYIVTKGIASKEARDMYQYLSIRQIRLNKYSNDILMVQTYSSCIIKLHTLNLIGTYYIENRGLIPMWSKLHGKVELYFKIAMKRRKYIE